MAIGQTVTSSRITTVWNGSTFAVDFSVVVPSGVSVLNVRIVGVYARIPPSTVAWNGNALTSRVTGDDGNDRAVAIYDLDSPMAATANLTLTAIGETTYVVIVTLLTGVDMAGTPRGTAGTNDAWSATGSLDITTVAGDVVLDVISSRNQTLTVGAGQTSQYNSDGPAAAGEDYAGASYKTASGTTTSMGWTLAADQRWVMAAIPYKPAAEGGGDPDDGLPPFFFFD